MTDVKVINRGTGKLETLPVEEANRRVAAGEGYDYPALDELERAERLEKFGGQQGQAAAETVARTATFGGFQGFGTPEEIAGRRQVLAEESPGVQFAAQAIGSTLPAIATGGLAGGAAGALGLGARGVAAAEVIAEGAAGGLSDEIEQAAIDDRPVSAGRAMLIGVGGELIGRAIPAAVKAGVGALRKAPTPAAAVAGEAIEDVAGKVAKRADEKLADVAPDMPPGPERDAALAATAPIQRQRADEAIGQAATSADALLDQIADQAPAKLEKEISGTSPGQIRWAAETAAGLRSIAETAPETHAAMLRESADALLQAKDGKAIWRAAADARKRIRDAAATEGALDRARKIAERMKARESQAGSVVVAEQAPIPLDDVRVPDKDGYLEPATPRRLKKHEADIRQAAETAVAGKSLKDLRALPLDEGPGAAASRAKVDAFKTDKSFRETGMLPSNNDRGRGGLPAFGIEADGQVYLSNGRHRLTAAIESGQETIVANLKKYDKKGNTVWDYVGPVRVGKAVSAAGPGPLPGKLVRKGKWQPQSYWDRVVDAEVAAFDDAEALGSGGLYEPADLKKLLFDSISDSEAVSVETARDRNELRRAIKAAVDDVDMHSSVEPHYLAAWGEPFLPSKGAERGMVDLGAAAGRVPWRDIAASPLGNVVGAGAGAYVGGQVGGQEGAAAGGLAGFAASMLLGRRGGRGLSRALSRAGERGMVDLGAGAANDVAAAGIRRTAKGARVLEHDLASGIAPDFSEWDPADFAMGKGRGKAAGKGAADYSGGQTISTYQRSIVDGLKKNAGFRENGRVTGDAGKLGSEPTFRVLDDGSVKLDHGRLRITAARELGRDTVYARVVRGAGDDPEVVFEGQVRVGRGPRGAQAEAGSVPPPAGGQAPPAASAAPAPSNPLVTADNIIGAGQTDVGVFGRAAEGAADLERAAAPGPGPRSVADELEDQLAAAERWKIGSDKARAGAADEARRLRKAESLKNDVDKAEAGKNAFRDMAGAAAGEVAEYALERAVGGAVPGAGLALKGAKYLWRKLDDSAKAQIAQTARTLLSPLTSSGRWGAARSAVAMTALDKFKGDAPDPRSAFESRRQMLTDAAASPQLAAAAMSQSLAGLARENPSNFIALAKRMTECLQYVSRNLPATVGVSLAEPKGVPLTDSELRDVADLWNTAFDPSSAFDDIARRTASPIQMQTLKELHPDIFNDLKQAITMQSPATFSQIDTQTKLSIDIMFGSDGAAGLFASSEAARNVQQANKRVPAKAPGARPLPPGAQAGTVESAGVRAVRSGVTNKGAV